MTAPITTAIVLAAGGSSRMGSPKALLNAGGRPLIVRHLEALSPYFPRVAVVLGHEFERIRTVIPKEFAMVLNDRWREGEMIDSLILALTVLEVEGAVCVTPVDAPPAEPATLKRLLAFGAPCVPCTSEGEAGHPVLIGAVQVRQLRRSPAPESLRSILTGVSQVVVEDPWLTLNLNTPEAWASYRNRFDIP